jgi:ribbon-helix-helix CopG family protein
MYGTMYGMDKTTVYLPRALKDALAAAAKRRQVSEAELIREGIALAIGRDEPRKPRIPLFDSGQPGLAARFDELLKGFGED